ncbi:hypothetical protein lerEdw1_009400, partial [Lerista edwardsae]
MSVSWCLLEENYNSQEALQIPNDKHLEKEQEEEGGSFLQLAAIFVRYPMEKQNSTVQQNKRPVGTGEASHVPQPSGIGEFPPWSEEGEEDLSAGRAPRWEDQWLDFLERVKSQGMLEEEEEEAALWGEAKVLLASLEPETETYWRPWEKRAERRE